MIAGGQKYFIQKDCKKHGMGLQMVALAVPVCTPITFKQKANQVWIMSMQVPYICCADAAHEMATF